MNNTEKQQNMLYDVSGQKIGKMVSMKYNNFNTSTKVSFLI